MRHTLIILSLVLSTAAQAQTPCEGGFADIYPCDKIDLLTFIPTNELGSDAGQNDIWGWTDPIDGHEYALLGKLDGTAFVDVTNPLSPILVGFLPAHNGSSSTWRDIKVYSDHAFIVSEAPGHGMQVFDLNQLRDVESFPAAFEESAHYDGFGNCHNVNINEETGYAYPIGTNLFSGGPHFINIQDPLNPALEGSYSGDGYSHDAQVVIYNGPDTDYQGREIYFGFHGNSSEGLVIVDVTEKSDPEFVSRTGYDCQDYTHQGWLTPDQRYVLLNDELDEGTFGYNTRTRIMDITDLDNPVLAGNYNSPVSATDHNVYTLGDHAYMSNYTSGLRVVDISALDDGLASEVAYFDVYPENDNAGYSGTWSNYPYFESGTIVVTHRTNGLFIVALQDLQGATAVDPLDTEICPAEVSVPEFEELFFTLSPNPANDILELRSDESVLSIQMLDVTGREVMNEVSATPSQSKNLSIDISSLKPGVYTIRVNGSVGTGQRFIKN
jgi:choice-of-anchor B domain-containing protein